MNDLEKSSMYVSALVNCVKPFALLLRRYVFTNKRVVIFNLVLLA